MAKLKIECLDKKVATRKIAKAVYKTLWQKSLFKAELVFHDSESMQNLNRTTRGIDSVTDVLSYPSMDNIRGLILTPEQCRTEMERKRIFLGSIVLCDERVRAQAKELGHSERRERDYLIVHGLLHLFGYDHMTEDDKKEMRAKEKKIMAILYPKEVEKIVQSSNTEPIEQEFPQAQDVPVQEQPIAPVVEQIAIDLPAEKSEQPIKKTTVRKTATKTTTTRKSATKTTATKKAPAKKTTAKKTTAKKAPAKSQTIKPRTTKSGDRI